MKISNFCLLMNLLIMVIYLFFINGSESIIWMLIGIQIIFLVLQITLDYRERRTLNQRSKR